MAIGGDQSQCAGKLPLLRQETIFFGWVLIVICSCYEEQELALVP